MNRSISKRIRVAASRCLRFVPVVLAVGLFLCVAKETSYAGIVSILASADADAYIAGGSGVDYQTSNYGDFNMLFVKNRDDAAAYSRKAYMKFDLPDIDDRSKIVAASLDLLFVDSKTSTYFKDKPYDILTDLGEDANFLFQVFYVTDDSWGETSINWGNAPANDKLSGSGMITDAKTQPHATLLGTFSLRGKGIGELTFGDLDLLESIRSDTNNQITLVITRVTPEVTSQGNLGDYVHAIASKEYSGGYGPKLILTVVPEPTSLVSVLGLAGCGLFAAARRRLRNRS